MTRLRSLAFVLLLQLALALNAYSGDPIPFAHPYQDGYVLVLWRLDYKDAELDQIFELLKKSGTKHVEIAHFGCQTDIHSTDVDGCEHRPMSFTIKLVERSISHGFKTTLLPLMAAKNWEWRGYFEPSNVDEWFRSYTQWIVRMAAEAQKRGMSEFVVGSEFSKLARYSDHWKQVIAEVRKVFNGPVIYTLNWDALNIGFFDSIDAIGVSAYFPISLLPNPSQDELDRGWKKRKDSLMALSRKWKRPIHITEVGYANVSNAASQPWEMSEQSKRDDSLQVRCFEAFRRAWRSEKGMVRANVWAMSGFEGHASEISSDPITRPAEQVLRKYFQERSTLKP